MNKKTVAFVPIKMNNERMPGKNTKSFEGGKPLITHLLKTLDSINELDEIYVFCSNLEIKNFLYGRAKLVQRSSMLDTSVTTGNQIFKSFAETKEASEADILVAIHATAPFITRKTVIKGIEAVKSECYDSALPVQKIQEFLWKDGRPINYDVTNIPRTQDLMPYYQETTGMYIFERHLILEENLRVGHKPYLIEVSKIEAQDINEPIDFEIANAIYKNIICNLETD